MKISRSIVLLAGLAIPLAAHAQFTPGHGTAAISLQQIDISRHTLGNGDAVPLGKISDRALYLDLDVGLADRWALALQLPFKSNRYVGSDPHDPRGLPGGGAEPFIDDGDFHAGWADWRVVLRYALRTDPIELTPFIAYSRPSHSYPFFAESALGTRQSRWQLGLEADSRFPAPMQNAYWRASVSHTFLQSRLGRHLSQDAASAELGVMLSQRLGAHLQLERSVARGGIEAPDGFFNPDGSFNPEIFLFHDALLNVRYNKASIGLDLQLDENDSVFVGVGRTLHGENVHLIDRAFTLGVRRSF